MHEVRRHARSKWMLEEVDEFIQADLIEDQVDAMIDLIYFALGTLVELGVAPDRIFEIVHRANMDKLGSDGKPIYNEDGKVVKPKDWIPPTVEIMKEILNQYKI